MKDAERIADSLSEAQRRTLLAVCKSNGIGVPVTHLYSGKLAPPWSRLWEYGLIQGKSGWQNKAVHTPLGLAVRSILLERGGHDGQ